MINQTTSSTIKHQQLTTSITTNEIDLEACLAPAVTTIIITITTIVIVVVVIIMIMITIIVMFL